MERVNENEPAIGVRRFDAGFQVPVAGAVGLLDLILRETKIFQLRAGQRVKREHKSGCVFNFLRAGNQPGARTAREQRDPGVNAQNFKRLPGEREKFRRHEDEAE